jgi:hypothetical protein
MELGKITNNLKRVVQFIGDNTLGRLAGVYEDAESNETASSVEEGSFCSDRYRNMGGTLNLFSEQERTRRKNSSETDL